MGEDYLLRRGAAAGDSNPDAEEVENLGRNLSGGFGLWGGLDSLPLTRPKKRALVRGWIAGVKVAGLNGLDAAALGDWKVGRWYIDEASGWTEETAATIQSKGKERADHYAHLAAKYEAGGSITRLRNRLKADYPALYGKPSTSSSTDLTRE